MAVREGRASSRASPGGARLPWTAGRLRVCLVSHGFYPVYGGSNLRFQRYIPRLQERGVQVHVLSGTPKRHWSCYDETDASWSDGDIGRLLPTEVIDGITVQRVRLSADRSPLQGWLFGRAIHDYCLAMRPDVLHCTTIPYVALPWIYRLHRTGLPTLLTQTLAARPKRNAVRRLLGDLVTRNVLRGFDRLVVGSEAMRHLLLRSAVRQPIEVIGHGVDLARFRPSVDAEERMTVRRALGIGANDGMVLAVGAIHPRKGSDLLMEAWHRVLDQQPDAHLVLVGPRQDRTQPSLKEFGMRIATLERDAPVPGRIHLTGLVKNVEEYMRAADVLVLPSRREGMPNAVLEAMASALPVVLTPFVGLPDEFGTPGVHYVLCERDPSALADSLQRLLADPERRREIGGAGHRRVERDASVEGSIDAYERIYRELAAEGRVRRSSGGPGPRGSRS